MRLFMSAALLTLSACSDQDKWEDNVATPALTTMTEQPGDWSALGGMIGRSPSDSGLIDSSAISVDLKSMLGRDAKAYRDAMMRAGALTRSGDLLVARSPDAWLVLHPEEHAMRAGLRQGSAWREWQTPGADVPAPR